MLLSQAAAPQVLEQVVGFLTQQSPFWGITEVARSLANASAACRSLYLATQKVLLLAASMLAAPRSGLRDCKVPETLTIDCTAALWAITRVPWDLSAPPAGLYLATQPVHASLCHQHWD